MRRLAILAPILALSACGSSERTPVDMSFRVAVETLENTCDDAVAPNGETAVVDILAKADGTVVFSERSGWIPGEGAYDGLSIRGGEVHHTFVLHAVGYDFDHAFDGSVDMESMDLVLDVARRKPGDGPFEECHVKVRMKGDRRPLWDPTSSDGRYVVRMENYGKVCPGDDPNPLGVWNGPLDVDPYVTGRAVLSFDEKETNVFVDAEIGADGSVAWDGEMYAVYSNGAFGEFEAHAEGTVLPGDVDLTLSYLPYGETGCPYVVRARGGKVLPSPNLLENEYRVNYLVDDDCSPAVNGVGPYEDEFDKSVGAILQDDGAVHLLEGPWRIRLPLEGNAFSQEYLYNWGEAYITYEGAFDPPFLDYTVEWHFWPGQEEYECHRRISASGHVRYWLEDEAEAASLSLAGGYVPAGIRPDQVWLGMPESETPLPLLRTE